ncbi:MAG: cysteine-rich KTR domain-containing protein [Clostridiales bacterium]|nr:cysteine-rich KTR domain-containing protein [Clostridiales bacterium]
MLCPVCNGKTRVWMREDTELIHFQLFCPKCKQERLINVKQFHITLVPEPEAKAQSR